MPGISRDETCVGRQAASMGDKFLACAVCMMPCRVLLIKASAGQGHAPRVGCERQRARIASLLEGIGRAYIVCMHTSSDV